MTVNLVRHDQVNADLAGARHRARIDSSRPASIPDIGFRHIVTARDPAEPERLCGPFSQWLKRCHRTLPRAVVLYWVESPAVYRYGDFFVH